MLSYAGVSLPLETPFVGDWTRYNLDYTWLREFCQHYFPPRGAFTRGFLDLWPPRPLRVGVLLWPRDATRFAVAHYLVTEERLKAIRPLVYSENTLKPQILHIDDGSGDADRQVNTEMYWLPPRPFQQFDPENLPRGQTTHWLLTLVDVRFFWWFKLSNLVINDDATWESLYEDVSRVLNVEIEVDEIPDAYGDPPDTLVGDYEPIPFALDSIARAVGQKIVRTLDGRVRAMNYGTAASILEENKLLIGPPDFQKVAGGEMLLREQT